jgi:hypothetical protein
LPDKCAGSSSSAYPPHAASADTRWDALPPPVWPTARSRQRLHQNRMWAPLAVEAMRAAAPRAHCDAIPAAAGGGRLADGGHPAQTESSAAHVLNTGSGGCAPVHTYQRLVVLHRRAPAVRRPLRVRRVYGHSEARCPGRHASLSSVREFSGRTVNESPAASRAGAGCVHAVGSSTLEPTLTLVQRVNGGRFVLSAAPCGQPRRRGGDASEHTFRRSTCGTAEAPPPPRTARAPESRPVHTRARRTAPPAPLVRPRPTSATDKAVEWIGTAAVPRGGRR